MVENRGVALRIEQYCYFYIRFIGLFIRRSWSLKTEYFASHPWLSVKGSLG